MKIETLTADHLLRIRVQPAQRCDPMYSPQEYLEAGEGVAGVDGEVVVFCAGRAYKRCMWAILSEAAGRYMLEITRVFRRLISLHGDGYLETVIAPGFPEAHRWARILGFKYAGRSGQFPDYDLYVRPEFFAP